MKIIDNVEFSHVKEVVISRKVFYIKDECLNFNLDETRTKKSVIENDELDIFMDSEDMAEYVRDFVGRKKWKIVFSSGTINIFKPDKHKPEERIIEKKSEAKKLSKTKKSKN